jgi:diacylglycerol O-acyltransferase / wax synthase
MPEKIAATDAIWLQDSAANLMVINAIIITDRLDLETLRAAFQRRIFEGPEASRFERLRCCITGRGLRRCWAVDRDFDIARHIFPTRARHLHSLEAIQAYVGQEASRKLDWDHPQWEIQVIDPFEEGTTALLARIHHSIGDGEALVCLLFTLMDGAWDQSNGISHASGPPPGEGRLGQFLRAAAIPLSAPGILLRRLTWVPDRSPMHGPALSGSKRVAWTTPLDLEVIKTAKHRIGATVNDVLMASVSGAFSQYLARRGGRAPSRFLISMPVNVRHTGESLRCENHFAPVPLELPAGPCALSQRILAVKTKMDQVKHSAVPMVIFELQRALLAFLPRALSQGLIDFLANKCTAVVTNITGPCRDLSLEGRRVRSILFWVPQRARIGVGISILSFAGKVQLGVIADEALVPDPATLIQAFEEEFRALRRL